MGFFSLVCFSPTRPFQKLTLIYITCSPLHRNGVKIHPQAGGSQSRWGEAARDRKAKRILHPTLQLRFGTLIFALRV